MQATTQVLWSVRDYNLAATLCSGQAFRWRWHGGAWEGVVGRNWVRLRQRDDCLLAETMSPDWAFLTNYLQTGINLDSIVSTFPDDEPMRKAVSACRGLRLLRQEPWECLASFILSSTKQIVQIQQIVALLCARFGEPVTVPPGCEPMFTFPTPPRLAAVSEQELRACKMGFRAPSLLMAARMVANAELDLERLHQLPAATAREELLRVRGVGEKIANCVLLFAYGFQDAFPVDVWVKKALQQLYFSKRRPNPRRLARFIATHFGPNAGYAQQYLFHYMRMNAARREDRSKRTPSGIS